MIKESLERNFGNKSFDSIPYLIQKLPKDYGICYQEYLIFKIRFLLETKELDTVSILLEKLDKSLLEDFSEKVEAQKLFLKGRYYYNKELNDSASYYYFKSLDYAKLHKDTLLQIKLFNSISGVFANLYQFDKAIEYANIGLIMAKQEGDGASAILILGNLISFNGKQYLKTFNKIYLDSAESASKRLIILAKKEKNDYALLKAYSGLGSCYFQYENYQKTLAYSDSILLFPKIKKYPKVILQAYGNICDSHLSLGNFKLAKIAGDSALKYAIILKDKVGIADVYYRLYDCENELKNYPHAIEYYKLHVAAKDSIKAEEQFLVVNELEQKYNKFENEKTISDLTKEKEINGLRIKVLVIGIVLFIILTLLIVFIYRQRSLKQKHVLLETEQRLNRSRINPHFFFNSITTLQGIALKENDGKKIFTNLFVFSKLMRETLESTYSDLVSIKKEISFLTNYIELQKLNLIDKFSFEVAISPEIDEETILIPSMIIQPFVENSIEHGFNEINSGGLIVLEFEQFENELLITLSDNGKGFQNDNVKKHNHISRAMQITTDRLNLINNLHKTNARFLLSSNTPVGCKVEIFLPLNLKDESSGN
ncbi:MAG: histidine kinase [Bacteroidota bacterium]|nr:histidine kinase [Bacteroidota bacterium]